LTTIRELKRRNSEAGFERIGEALRATLNRAIKAAGLSGACKGLHTNPHIALDLPDPALAPLVSTLFIQEMARRGVHTYMGFKATLAHTDEDIRQTGAAAEEAFRIIKSGLDRGAIHSLLECDIKKEPFRRLVR
jgi:glutamate-1-semialdehyde aminotransferase